MKKTMFVLLATAIAAGALGFTDSVGGFSPLAKIVACTAGAFAALMFLGIYAYHPREPEYIREAKKDRAV